MVPPVWQPVSVAKTLLMSFIIVINIIIIQTLQPVFLKWMLPGRPLGGARGARKIVPSYNLGGLCLLSSCSATQPSV